MDKTAIKNFSIWARNKLIADITYKAGLLGITEEGIMDALPQSTKDAEFYDIGTKEPYAIHGEEIKQRKELVSAIRKKATQLEYKDAYQNVIEEVAYTWYNRLIAIRFMEVNDYMPAHIRVLSSESDTKLEPDLVTTPFDAEIEFTQQETEHIMHMKNDNQVDALFRYLFIKQCNALNAYLPKLFERTSDYTELLLNISVTDQDGIVFHLTHDIKEDDFNISIIGADGKPTGQVEIIGWMYQYYNTEPKDEAFAFLKKNVKITKERIPAATQLFTPDWIVRYMVENSVGRLWLEGHENEELKKGWKYYLDEAEQETDVEEQLRAIREEYKNIKPEEIRVIDPCMGSGHILVYAFDVLMQIYESNGYSQRDAARSIVENNIYGLDIDDRAFQLAYFAIMMKGRSYNRRFLTLGIEPNLCAIQESNGIQYDKDMGEFLLSEEHRETLQYLLHTFLDAKEYGSILNVERRDYDGFLRAWEQTAEQTVSNVVMLLWYNEWNQVVPVLAKQAKILSAKYDVVITNPPYMSNRGMDEKLTNFVKKNYKTTKYDLFAAMIEKCSKMVVCNGMLSMITQHSWMFLSSFEKFRKEMLLLDILNMVHLGARAFEEISGEVVQTVSFVMRLNNLSNYKGHYVRLVEYDSQNKKEKNFLERKNSYFFEKDKFDKIDGSPVVYWISPAAQKAFENTSRVVDYARPRVGQNTGDNERFLRYWSEVDIRKIGFGIKHNELETSEYKWIPYNKGGSFRRWYGNFVYVVNWESDGKEIKDFAVIRNHGKHWSRYIQNIENLCRGGVSWSDIASTRFGCRYMPDGFICDVKGSAMYPDEDMRLYMLAFLNSKIAIMYLQMLNPTTTFQVGNISALPLMISNKGLIEELTLRNVELSKSDWDEFETSWDFTKHPFIKYKSDNCLISDAFNNWEKVTETRFQDLKTNEEKINDLFIDMYGLQDEMTKTIDDRDIAIRLADKSRDIKSFLSYLVGCLFGRYSLEKEGLILAGAELKSENYYDVILDEDNIIPISDEEYLEDDIVVKICQLLIAIFGEETLEDNLDYIASGLSNKGMTSREIIRNYFLNDFYKEHCAIYSVATGGKRPIYWLFDSGKQNGFKALIYMHRYNADTIGNLRVDYLHRMERIYESEINRMQDTIDNSQNAREVTAASKRKEKLQKQLKECQEYDEKIGHLALSRIEIDLDDGVKVNYEKVQTARDGKKYQVLAKI